MLLEKIINEHSTYFLSNTYFIVMSCIFVLLLTSLFLFKFAANESNTKLDLFLQFVINVLKAPLIALLILFYLCVATNLLAQYFPNVINLELINQYAYVLNIAEFLVYFWLILNFLHYGKQYVLHLLIDRKNYMLFNVVSTISGSIQAALLLVMLNILIPQLTLTGIPLEFLQNVSRVLLIVTLGWIFIRTVDVVCKIIETQYALNDTSNVESRRINTQLVIIKRLVTGIGVVVTLALVLISFDSVKTIGTGLLTTAGIVSAVGAFASQQSLGRIFAGLHIAFTQPIRIGDTVIIENEFGQVEEITLSYIVIKLWDLRRLILPTDYFTSKGLQNLTRSSSDLLGTIYIYTDYTLPVEVVRNKFTEFLEASNLWDKKVGTFQVTELKESSMEIRALVSAVDSSTLWNLRCQIREKLIDYIVQNHPECLSKAGRIKAA